MVPATASYCSLFVLYLTNCQNALRICVGPHAATEPRHVLPGPLHHVVFIYVRVIVRQGWAVRCNTNIDQHMRDAEQHSRA